MRGDGLTGTGVFKTQMADVAQWATGDGGALSVCLISDSPTAVGRPTSQASSTLQLGYDGDLTPRDLTLNCIKPGGSMTRCTMQVVVIWGVLAHPPQIIQKIMLKKFILCTAVLILPKI
eukprot:SAG11_NODE_2392_length_3410_cov_20.904259_3_plen_119_part_00